MPGRLAFDPPWWQVALSIVTLFATAVFFVWVAGRIYRVGILMYGKKVSLKEIGKWLVLQGIKSDYGPRQTNTKRLTAISPVVFIQSNITVYETLKVSQTCFSGFR